MARFITMLSGTLPPLVGTFAGHDVRTINNGQTIRNGLIESRSALSTDIYAELFPENKDGGLGVFFPSDLVNVTSVAGQITASAYTSTEPGIVIPSDYSIRPIEPILSNNRFASPTVPLNRVSASLVTYQSASKAVRDTLTAINLSTGIPDNFGGPFTRLGRNPSRTLHSIYHNPTLAFFSWDDFTPGTPNPTNFIMGDVVTARDNITANTDVAFLEFGVDNFIVTASWEPQYAADVVGTIFVSVVLDEGFPDTQITSFTGALTNTTEARLSFPAAQFARFSESQGLIFGRYQVQFSDATIPEHTSSVVTRSDISLGVRGQVLYRRTDTRAMEVSVFNSNPTAFCSLPYQTTFAINTLESSSRLYQNKSGDPFTGGVLAGVPYYVAFGALGDNSTVYKYDTGILASPVDNPTATVNCSGISGTSGTAGTSGTTTGCVGPNGSCDETTICCPGLTCIGGTCSELGGT